jgi:hypothetical protein
MLTLSDTEPCLSISYMGLTNFTSAGGGIGLERLVMLYLGIGNIRYLSFAFQKSADHEGAPLFSLVILDASSTSRSRFLR